jgi:hypothetical protein
MLVTRGRKSWAGEMMGCGDGEAEAEVDHEIF